MALRNFEVSVGTGTLPFTFRWEGSTDGGNNYTNLGKQSTQQVDDTVFNFIRVTATNVAGASTSAGFDLGGGD